MIQSKNHGHSNDRPSMKTQNHSNPHYDHHAQKACDCGPDCKCGCNEGKPCSCGCQNSAVASGVTTGIFNLIGACIVAGTIFTVVDALENSVSRPAPVAPAPIAAQAPKDLNNIIAQYIKENPEAIISSLEAYDRKQRAERAKQQPQVADSAMLAEIVADKTNNVLGNAKGSFVVVEFFDYNCGYCKMMNKKMAEAIKKSDNIRWILMDAPIFGEKSEVIARYAIAAAKQGKFAEYHAAIGEASDKTEEGLKAIGKKLGLNVDKLAKDANSQATKDKIVKTREYTKKLNLGGVPMFIIDGKIQGGAFPDEQMEEYIKQANAMKAAKKK